MSNEYEIIVIGAGSAGLMAAAELSAKGKRVLILEARDRIGGRAHTFSDNGIIYEAGSEFIHGDLPLTLSLLKEGGLQYEETTGEMGRSKNGKWIIDEDNTEGWDGLMKKMKHLKTDVDLQSFLDLKFKGNQYRELRNSAIRYAEGFDLANPAKASVLELYKEWKKENYHAYRIVKGYGALMDFILQKSTTHGCQISLGQIVKEIQWKKNDVVVFTAGQQQFRAKKIVVTVPLPLLQDESNEAGIQFKPSLGKIHEAFRRIGYGQVIKILLSFKYGFWQAKRAHLGFVVSDQPIPTWWLQTSESSHLLTAWIGGPNAEKLGLQTQEEIIRIAINSLAVIFHEKPESLKAQLEKSWIFNWHKDKFALGGYAFPYPESRKARKLINKSIEETLFFAGEAVYEGPAPGTVEAALNSGKEITPRVLI